MRRERPLRRHYATSIASEVLASAPHRDVSRLEHHHCSGSVNVSSSPPTMRSPNLDEMNSWPTEISPIANDDGHAIPTASSSYQSVDTTMEVPASFSYYDNGQRIRFSKERSSFWVPTDMSEPPCTARDSIRTFYDGPSLKDSIPSLLQKLASMSSPHTKPKSGNKGDEHNAGLPYQSGKKEEWKDTALHSSILSENSTYSAPSLTASQSQRSERRLLSALGSSRRPSSWTSLSTHRTPSLGAFGSHLSLVKDTRHDAPERVNYAVTQRHAAVEAPTSTTPKNATVRSTAACDATTRPHPKHGGCAKAEKGVRKPRVAKSAALKGFTERGRLGYADRFLFQNPSKQLDGHTEKRGTKASPQLPLDTFPPSQQPQSYHRQPITSSTATSRHCIRSLLNSVLQTSGSSLQGDVGPRQHHQKNEHRYNCRKPACCDINRAILSASRTIGQETVEQKQQSSNGAALQLVQDSGDPMTLRTTVNYLFAKAQRLEKENDLLWRQTHEWDPKMRVRHLPDSPLNSSSSSSLQSTASRRRRLPVRQLVKNPRQRKNPATGSHREVSSASVPSAASSIQLCSDASSFSASKATTDRCSSPDVATLSGNDSPPTEKLPEWSGCTKEPVLSSCLPTPPWGSVARVTERASSATKDGESAVDVSHSTKNHLRETASTQTNFDACTRVTRAAVERHVTHDNAPTSGAINHRSGSSRHSSGTNLTPSLRSHHSPTLAASTSWHAFSGRQGRAPTHSKQVQTAGSLYNEDDIQSSIMDATSSSFPTTFLERTAIVELHTSPAYTQSTVRRLRGYCSSLETTRQHLKRRLNSMPTSLRKATWDDASVAPSSVIDPYNTSFSFGSGHVGSINSYHDEHFSLQQTLPAPPSSGRLISPSPEGERRIFRTAYTDPEVDAVLYDVEETPAVETMIVLHEDGMSTVTKRIEEQQVNPSFRIGSSNRSNSTSPRHSAPHPDQPTVSRQRCDCKSSTSIDDAVPLSPTPAVKSASLNPWSITWVPTHSLVALPFAETPLAGTSQLEVSHSFNAPPPKRRRQPQPPESAGGPPTSSTATDDPSRTTTLPSAATFSRFAPREESDLSVTESRNKTENGVVISPSHSFTAAWSVGSLPSQRFSAPPFSTLVAVQPSILRYPPPPLSSSSPTSSSISASHITPAKPKEKSGKEEEPPRARDWESQSSPHLSSPPPIHTSPSFDSESSTAEPENVAAPEKTEKEREALLDERQVSMGPTTEVDLLSSPADNYSPSRRQGSTRSFHSIDSYWDGSVTQSP